jgi:hypothetical protein
MVCVAAAALWVRRHHRHDFVGRFEVDVGRLKWSRWHAMSDRGTLSFGYDWVAFDSRKLLEDYARNYAPASGWYGGSATPNGVRVPSFWGDLGFSRQWKFDRPSAVGNATANLFSGLEFPHWVVVSLAAMPPGLQLRRHRRVRKRMCAGRCPHYGYDLRATPGRCPECGNVSSLGNDATPDSP